MRNPLSIGLVALSLTLLSVPASAGDLTDLILQPGAISAAAEAGPIRYHHIRQLPDLPKEDAAPQKPDAAVRLQPVADGIVELAKLDGENQIVLRLGENGTSRDLGQFSSQAANPMLLFFLENIVRSTAFQTGGSPFYIRNRIRDAMVAVDLQNAGEREEITLTPFALDPNAARLGDFAGLTVKLTLDATAPGHLQAMQAEAGTGSERYLEALTLVEVQ